MGSSLQLLAPRQADRAQRGGPMRESGLVLGASVLDVGCGSGLLARQLSAAGFVVRGAAVVTLAPLARQVSYRTRQPGGVLGNPFLLQTLDAFAFIFCRARSQTSSWGSRGILRPSAVLPVASAGGMPSRVARNQRPVRSIG